ncbi:MAG: TRAP transporter substrate-binding protein [Planctomycetaceae bacterium]|nr:TRAP transporter substrate-binding protein [Planctomycetaceae bacterium]
MQHTVKRLSLAVAFVAAFACVAHAADRSYNLVLGGIQSSEDTATKAMQMLADLAHEKSGGTISIEVFPASQLGDALTQIEAVGMGSQDMFIDAGGFISVFAPDKNSESMFFLFDSEAHYRAFLASDVTKSIEETFLAETGARVIANNWVRVPRCMASKRPLKSLADFAGLKTRVPDIKAYLDSVIALGASPTQVAWGETYLALKQGVVDASEGPLDQLYTMNFYEATMNVVLTNHLRDNLVVTINDRKFQGMSDNQRTAIVEAATEAGDWYAETCTAAAETNVHLMKDNGCTFWEIDTAPLKAAVLKRAIELENSGAWSKGIIEKIEAAKQ